MAASRVVESGGLFVLPAEAGACLVGSVVWGAGGVGCSSTTYGAVWTVEESRRLTGLGLVPPVGPPVAAVLLAGGIIIQYGGGGSSSPSGSCKISSSSLVTFWAIKIFPSPP